MNSFLARLEPIPALHRDLHHKGYINDYQQVAFSVRHRLDGMAIVAGLDAKMMSDISLNSLNCHGDDAAEIYWHAAIYARYPHITTIIHSQAACTRTVSQIKKPLRPMLDDFAQIIGPCARLINPPSCNKAPRVSRALRNRGALLLRGCGALCIGESIEDAFAAAYVCEKNAKAMIEASFLGGAKPINIFESYLMHVYYQLKYSKRKK